jgi:thiamine-phosphate pyrophosphorylase
MAEIGCRLYLISPPAIDLATFGDQLRAALDGGDVASFQLRLPGADDETVLRAADALLAMVQDRDVAFLLEGHPGLAKQLGCDGVHITSEESVSALRKQIGADLILGVGCGASTHAAMEAGEAGADYVSFGPFFDSANTQSAERVDVDVLRNWALTMTIPSVAIGGITIENCPDLVRAGADFLAVLGAVWTHDSGPKAAVAAFNAAITGA